METTMELDDLKHAWKTLDRRLEQQNAINLQLLRDGRLDRMRRGLRPLVWGQAVQMLIGALGMLWVAPFWVEHVHEPALLICGLVMHAYCLGLVLVGALMQVRIARIDYAAPVLEIQRQLLTLRRTFIRGGMLIGLPWWFLIAPLLAVLSNGAIFESGSSTSWFWWQLAIGAVGLLATGWFHRWSNQPQRAALGRTIEDGAAGGSIRRAEAALEELTRFERS